MNIKKTLALTLSLLTLIPMMAGCTGTSTKMDDTKISDSFSEAFGEFDLNVPTQVPEIIPEQTQVIIETSTPEPTPETDELSTKDLESIEELINIAFGVVGIKGTLTELEYEDISDTLCLSTDLFKYYLGKDVGKLWDFADPKMKLWGAYYIDADSADWLLKNIFCIEPDRSFENDYCYYYGDNFYFVQDDGGVLDSAGYIVDYCKLDDNLYGFLLFDTFDGDAYTYYATVSKQYDEKIGSFWRVETENNEPVAEKHKLMKDKYYAAVYAAFHHNSKPELDYEGKTYYPETNYDFAFYDITGDGEDDVIIKESSSKYAVYEYDSQKREYIYTKDVNSIKENELYKIGTYYETDDEYNNDYYFERERSMIGIASSTLNLPESVLKHFER